MNRFHAAEHLPSDEVGRRYKRCPNPREKTHWQIIWLLQQPGGPRPAAEVARLAG